MTLTEKLEFVEEIVASVKQTVLARLKLLPETDWDGFELRRFLADHFRDNSFKLAISRNKAYKKTFQEMLVTEMKQARIANHA